MPRHPAWPDLALAGAMAVGALLVAEVALRILTEPYGDCYGAVLGVDLPPCRLRSPYASPETNVRRDAPYEDLVVDGRRITVGDLWGAARFDSAIGFVAEEGARSANGWWTTDEAGARIGTDPPETGDGTVRRVLVIGDSYAAGTRLPYEETWAFVLDDREPSIDVVNFGMDGYGMAQARLRYLSVREQIEHDLVLLLWAPEEDLWRDINVRRDVGGSWPLFWVLPRYIPAPDGPRLVPSPFGPGSEAALGPAATERLLREHLRLYDRFYWEPWWADPGETFRPTLHRLGVAVYHELRTRRIREGLMDPEGEAMRTSVAILGALEEDVSDRRRRFVLALLPSESALASADERFWERWDRMKDSACAAVAHCVDLSPGLRSLPADSIDRAYDGTHFGPRASREIGRLLAAALGDADLPRGSAPDS